MKTGKTEQGKKVSSLLSEENPGFRCVTAFKQNFECCLTAGNILHNIVFHMITNFASKMAIQYLFSILYIARIRYFFYVKSYLNFFFVKTLICFITIMTY